MDENKMVRGKVIGRLQYHNYGKNHKYNNELLYKRSKNIAINYFQRSTNLNG